jgi:superfamily II DNA or RNA helicase
MTQDIWKNNINSLRISDMKGMLKETGGFFSLKNRDEYIKRVENIQNCLSFKWRSDQQEVIDIFSKFEHKNYVIHAVFGAGKTTLLLGLLINGIIKKLFNPNEIMFVSFNISIKNDSYFINIFYKHILQNKD